MKKVALVVMTIGLMACNFSYSQCTTKGGGSVCPTAQNSVTKGVRTVRYAWDSLKITENTSFTLRDSTSTSDYMIVEVLTQSRQNTEIWAWYSGFQPTKYNYNNYTYGSQTGNEDIYYAGYKSGTAIRLYGDSCNPIVDTFYVYYRKICEYPNKSSSLNAGKQEWVGEVFSNIPDNTSHFLGNTYNQPMNFTMDLGYAAPTFENNCPTCSASSHLDSFKMIFYMDTVLPRGFYQVVCNTPNVKEVYTLSGPSRIISRSVSGVKPVYRTTPLIIPSAEPPGQPNLNACRASGRISYEVYKDTGTLKADINFCKMDGDYTWGINKWNAYVFDKRTSEYLTDVYQGWFSTDSSNFSCNWGTGKPSVAQQSCGVSMNDSDFIVRFLMKKNFFPGKYKMRVRSKQGGQAMLTNLNGVNSYYIGNVADYQVNGYDVTSPFLNLAGDTGLIIHVTQYSGNTSRLSFVSCREPKNPGNVTSSRDTACVGGEVTLTVDTADGTETQWFKKSCGGAGGIYIGSGASITVTMDTSTTFYVRNRNQAIAATDTLNKLDLYSPNCSSKRVTVVPVPGLPSAPNPRTECSSSAYTFNFDSVQSGIYGDIIEWDISTAFTHINSIANLGTITHSVASGSKDTIYLRSRRSDGGCVSSSTLTTAQTLPLPSNPGNPISNSPQCSGNVTLTRSGTPPAGETWYWQTAANGTATTSSGNSFTALTSGNYYIRSRNNMYLCWSAGSGNANVIANPLIDTPIISSSQSICSDTNINFVFDSIQIGQGGDSIEWSLQLNFISANSVANNGKINLSVGISATDTFWLRTKSTSTGCTSNTVMRTGTVHALPIPDVSPLDTIVFKNERVVLRATGSQSYYWTQLYTFADTVSLTALADTAVYEVVFTNNYGCQKNGASRVIAIEDSAAILDYAEHMFGNLMSTNDSNYYAITSVIDSLLKNFQYSVDEEEEDGFYARYNKWKYFWRTRIGPDGDLNLAKKIYKLQFGQFSNNCSLVDKWHNLGPDQNCKQSLGILNAIWVDPNPTASSNPYPGTSGNPNYILVGSRSGGLWRTTNAADPDGPTWENLSDLANPLLAGMGVNDIAVNPLNYNDIYVTAGIGKTFPGDDNYSPGVLRLNNGNWTVEVPIPMNKIKFAPWSSGGSSVIFGTSSNSIYRKVGGDPWELVEHINTAYEHGSLDDIEFVNEPSGSTSQWVIYVTGSDADARGGGVHVVKSSDLGHTWTDITAAVTANIPNTTQKITNGDFSSGFSSWFNVGNGQTTNWTVNVNTGTAEAPFTGPNQTSVCYTPIAGSSAGSWWILDGPLYNISFSPSVPANTSLKIYLTGCAPGTGDCNASNTQHPNVNVLGSLNATPEQAGILLYDSENPNLTTTNLINKQFLRSYLSVYWRYLVIEAKTKPGYINGSGVPSVDNISIKQQSLISINIDRQDDNNIWALCTRTFAAPSTYVVHSSDNGVTWSSTQQSAGISPGYFPMFFVSKVIYNGNPLMYFAYNSNYGTDNFISIDAGQSFDVEIDDENHADTRAALLYHTEPYSNFNPQSPITNDILFIATDGGLARKPAGAAFFQDFNGKGLSIRENYKVATTEADARYITCAGQDNGTFEFDGKTWEKTRGTDGHSVATNNHYTIYGVNAGSMADAGSISFKNCDDGISATTNDVVASLNIGCPYFNGQGYLGLSNVASFLSRPIAFHFCEADQKEYFGLANLYSIGGADNTILNTTPILDFNGAEGNIVDFDVTSGPSIIYVVRDVPWHENQVSYPGRVWVTTSGIAHDLVDITPPDLLSEDRLVTSVISDPKNPSRCWISVSGFVTDNSDNFVSDKHVYYSEDEGQTWCDISNGLPAFPVNKLIYYKGSDDMIFAATDVGVYRWVKSLSGGCDGHWECFNNGLPACVVHDLAINICGQKMIAGTWGRGIWEIDLPKLEYIVDVPGETWSSDRAINSDIRIKPGAVLTIQNPAVVRMARNTNIIIEPQGKLMVDQATITNNCESMWGGIIVEGDKTKEQYLNNSNDAVAMSSYQGFLFLNGATVENANDAIRLWKPSDGWVNNSDLFSPQGGTGGIVHAQNSMFRNNRRSAEFMFYRHFPSTTPQIESSNLSYFKNCNFTTDNHHLSDHPFLTHVTLWGVHGVTFEGCSFSNDDTRINGTTVNAPHHSSNELGYAIHSIDADYTVDRHFTGVGAGGPIYHQSIIKNMYMGILAENSTTTAAIRILNTNFEDNQAGLELIGSYGSSINGNLFSMGHLRNSISPSGTFLGDGFDHSSQFNHSLNEFEFNTTGGTNGYRSIGSGFINTGELDNESYANSYTGVDFASLANLNNRGTGITAGISGLQFLCNENNNADDQADITVWSDVITPTDGIRDKQGSSLTPAGNIFSQPTVNQSTHQFNNSNNSVRYYWESSAEEPVLNNISTNVLPIKISQVAECPSDPFGEWGMPGVGDCEYCNFVQQDIESKKIAFESAYSHLQETKINLLEKIDNGQTEQLKQQIASVDSSGAFELFLTIDSISPYVSEDILFAVLARGDVFNPRIVYPLLLHNPNSLTSEAIFQQAQLFLSNALIDTLRKHIADSTERGIIEDSVAYFNRQVKYLNRLIINAIIWDSAGFDHSQYRYWLARLNEPEADYAILDDWLLLGSLDSALIGLDSISAKYRLTGAQLHEFNSKKDLIGLKISLITDTTSIAKMDSNQIKRLDSIAASGLTIGARAAGAILHFFYQLPYETQFQLPTSGSELRRSNLSIPADSNKIEGVFVRAYPNPAGGYEIFEFKLPKENADGMLMVVDLMGRTMASIVINSTQESAVLDLENWERGIYFYKLISGQRDVGGGKFEIIK